MKLEKDERVRKWLRNEWNGQLEFDKYNVPKMKKHTVYVKDVEYFKQFYFNGRHKDRETYGEDRYMAMGVFLANEPAMVIFSITQDGQNGPLMKVRPISCRRIELHERVFYKQHCNDFDLIIPPERPIFQKVSSTLCESLWTSCVRPLADRKTCKV